MSRRHCYALATVRLSGLPDRKTGLQTLLECSTVWRKELFGVPIGTGTSLLRLLEQQGCLHRPHNFDSATCECSALFFLIGAALQDTDGGELFDVACRVQSDSRPRSACAEFVEACRRHRVLAVVACGCGKLAKGGAHWVVVLGSHLSAGRCRHSEAATRKGHESCTEHRATANRSSRFQTI